MWILRVTRVPLSFDNRTVVTYERAFRMDIRTIMSKFQHIEKPAFVREAIRRPQDLKASAIGTRPTRSQVIEVHNVYTLNTTPSNRRGVVVVVVALMCKRWTQPGRRRRADCSRSPVARWWWLYVTWSGQSWSTPPEHTLAGCQILVVG